MKNCIGFILLFICQITFGQNLVSYELLGEISAADAETEFDLPGGNLFDQKFYKVTYLTEHQDGEVREASGWVGLPQDIGRAYPTFVYQHGTAFSRTSVPSRDNETFFGKIMAASGYVAVLPDYLGLGDSEGIHPYMNADTESSAAADLILAAREIVAQEDLHINSQLFITGYSQGGHASAALHRDVEAGRYADITSVTAGSHLSGPYSISDRMIEFTLTDRVYESVSFLPWVAISILESYPDIIGDLTLEDIFLPDYITPINQFKNELIGLIPLNLALTSRLFANVGVIQPRAMIQPDILDAIFNDPDHPFNVALRDNDLIDWVPQAPTRLMGCEGDDVVWYENSLLALETMTQNGATDLAIVELGPTRDHGECVDPTVENTIEFFAQFQEIGFVLDTDDIFQSCNPTITQSRDLLDIAFDADCNQSYIGKILSVSGQEVATFDGLNDGVSTGELRNGIYVLQLIGTDGSIFSHKFIK